MIYFSCEEVGHIAARCPNREEKDEKKHSKYKGKKDFKIYKDYTDKGKKSCFMAKDLDSSKDDEMVYIVLKDESNAKGDKMVLISHVSKNHRLIVDSGFSYHMIGEKRKV